MTPAIVLHSTLTPPAVAAALLNSIDQERRTLFSLSGFAGDRPVLGEVSGNTFRLQKRRYWKNDFAPHFYGRLLPGPGGTRIEGYFDMSPWVRRFMRFWLAGVVVIGGPIAILALMDMVTGSHRLTGDTRVGLIVPPSMIIFGILLPRCGRLLGRGEESVILGFLEHTLAAQRERASIG